MAQTPRPALLIQSGHTQPVSALALSPDGKTVATVSPDRTARLWDAATGRELRVLRLDSLPVDVAFSTDGKLLRSGAQVWQVVSGQQITASGEFPAAGPATTGPGRYGLLSIAAAGKDLILYAPPMKPDIITGAIVSADGAWLATNSTGLAPAQWKIWDTARGLLVSSVAGRAPVFSADSKALACVSGPEMTSVTVLNLATKQTSTFGRKSASSVAAAFSADGKWLAVATNDRQIKLWDLVSGREVGTFGTVDFRLVTLVFSPDSTMLAAGGTGGRVTLYDVATGRRGPVIQFGLSKLGTSRSDVTIAFSPSGKFLALGWPEGLLICNTADGEDFNTIPATVRPGGALAFVSDTTLLAQAPDDGAFALWNVATGGIVRKFADIPRGVGAVSDSGILAAQDANGGTTQLWDIKRNKKIKTLRDFTAQRLALSRDGKLLAATLQDGRVQVFDTARGRIVATLADTPEIPSFTAFSADAAILAKATEGGPVQLSETIGGRTVLNLVGLNQGDWLAVTPDSYFDGSPPAWNLVLWRYDEDTFNVAPIEWFFNEFYYPALLSEVMNGVRPRAPSDFALKDRRQPLIKISLAAPDVAPNVASRTVKVRLEITDAAPDKTSPQGCGARDVRLLRNGALVGVWRGDVLRGQKQVTLETDIRVLAGANQLTAYGFNRDNVKSKNAALSVTGDEKLRRRGVAHLLAIGLNEYANRQYNLNFALADAQLFAAEVKRQLESQQRYERVNVVTLFDRAATKAAILNALRQLTREAQPEDAVFVYYAGHGTAQREQFFLIPHDLGYTGGRDALDEAGLSTILAHSVSDRDLQEVFETIDAGAFVLVLDACNSGQALEAEEKRRGPMNAKGLAQLAYEKGMFILTASQSYQAALEVAQLGHGLLTYALVTEGLQQASADSAPHDGQILVREWFDYATARVPVMQQEKIRRARQLGLNLTFGAAPLPTLRAQSAPPSNAQRPRLFYRRELEAVPLVIKRL